MMTDRKKAFLKELCLIWNEEYYLGYTKTRDHPQG